MTNQAKRWQLQPNIQLKSSNNQQPSILVDKTEAIFFRCNNSANLLLQALSTGTTISEMTTQLCQQYQVSNGQARADICALLQQMTQWELVYEH